MSPVSGVILGKALSYPHAAEKTFASSFMQGKASAKFLSSDIASGLDNLETSSLPLLPLNYYSLSLIISYTWGIPAYYQRKLKLLYIFKREKMKQFRTGCKNIPDKECISPASSLLMEIFIPFLIIFSWRYLQRCLCTPKQNWDIVRQGLPLQTPCPAQSISLCVVRRKLINLCKFVSEERIPKG